MFGVGGILVRQIGRGRCSHICAHATHKHTERAPGNFVQCIQNQHTYEHSHIQNDHQSIAAPLSHQQSFLRTLSSPCDVSLRLSVCLADTSSSLHPRKLTIANPHPNHLNPHNPNSQRQPTTQPTRTTISNVCAAAAATTTSQNRTKNARDSHLSFGSCWRCKHTHTHIRSIWNTCTFCQSVDDVEWCNIARSTPQPTQKRNPPSPLRQPKTHAQIRACRRNQREK